MVKLAAFRLSTKPQDIHSLLRLTVSLRLSCASFQLIQSIHWSEKSAETATGLDAFPSRVCSLLLYWIYHTVT